jgi:acetyl/propionyl-CoA carboxylase alpha subunit
MRRALDEFVIEGIKTTIPFHRQLMDDPRYIDGDWFSFYGYLNGCYLKVFFFVNKNSRGS